MEEMECYIFVLCLGSHLIQNHPTRLLEIIFIEIEPDKCISGVEFLDNARGMTPKSEGTIHDDIWLRRANIEPLYILLKKDGNMSKTLCVQFCQKVMSVRKYFFPPRKYSFLLYCQTKSRSF